MNAIRRIALTAGIVGLVYLFHERKNILSSVVNPFHRIGFKAKKPKDVASEQDGGAG